MWFDERRYKDNVKAPKKVFGLHVIITFELNFCLYESSIFGESNLIILGFNIHVNYFEIFLRLH